MVCLPRWKSAFQTACMHTCSGSFLAGWPTQTLHQYRRAGGVRRFASAAAGSHGKGQTGNRSSKVQSTAAPPSTAAPVAKLMGEDLLAKNFIQNEASVEDYQAARFMEAVVKVYCVHCQPNFSLPWQRNRQYSTTSTGFMVASDDKKRWLLTNAHSVEYSSQVQVKRRGDDQKFIAEVLAIGTECDIALLTVHDNTFWEGVTPLELGSLPRLQDPVACVGYPVGGDTISVTSGVVSRIEVTSYVHGATELLGVQIDAAINSGNSGGPAFNLAGQVVGIAFQSLAGSDAENIGYLIPTNVIQHFLSDYRKNGRFTGFPALGVHWQRMESRSLKEAYKLTGPRKGVLVRQIVPVADAARHLQPYDIIMKFDDVQVACDGTVPFRQGERIAFNFLASQKFAGEHAKLKILRDGEELEVDVQLARPRALVPLHLDGGNPSYLVVAGIVFSVCTEPYLQSEYGSDYMSDSPVKLLEKTLHGKRQTPDEEVVILSQVLACEATLGYEDLFNVQVLKFNGEKVKNLRHLSQLVLANTEKFMRFDLDYSEVVVLNAKVARAATSEVLQMHSIPSQVSEELRDLLADQNTTSINRNGMQPDA